MLTYDGRWAWDWTIFLAKATINAYKDGVEEGYATYSVDGETVNQNLSKWRSAEGTIKKMMSNVFNQMKDTN